MSGVNHKGRGMDERMKDLLTHDPIEVGDVLYGAGMIGVAVEYIKEGDVIEIDLTVPPHRRRLRPKRDQ